MSPSLVPLDGPYQLFLTLGFAVGAVLAWRAGRAGNLPPLAWAVLLGVAASAGLIGSKLFFFDLRSALPGEKTVLGGILLGVTLVPLAARALGLQIAATLDRLTVPTLVAMAIGRIGCFLAGCCLGTHSHLLDARHPTVLYEAALDVALVAVLRRHAPVGQGLRIGAGVLGYAGIRFLTEFVRDGRVSVGGFNPVQWFMLVIVVTAAVWTFAVARRTGSGHTVALPAPARERVTRDRVAVLSALCVGALAAIPLLAPDWLTPLERFVLGAIALAVGSTALWLLAPRAVRVLGVPALGALTIVPPDTLARSEWDIGVDRGSGRYEQLLLDGGCDPSIYDEREFGLTQASLTRRTRRGQGWTALTLSGVAGRDMSRDGTTDAAPVRAVGVGLSFASADAVLRAGVVAGDVSRDGMPTSAVVPIVGARFGRQGRFFLEGQAAPVNAFATTGEFSYLGVGIKFSSERSRLLVGTGDGLVLDLDVPVGNRFTLRVSSRTSDAEASRSFVRAGASWHLPSGRR